MVYCPFCGKAAIFVEDDEDAAWRCDDCHAVIEEIEDAETPS